MHFSIYKIVSLQHATFEKSLFFILIIFKTTGFKSALYMPYSISEVENRAEITEHSVYMVLLNIKNLIIVDISTTFA